MTIVVAIVVLVVLLAVVNVRSSKWLHVPPPDFDPDDTDEERTEKAQAHAALLSELNHHRWRRVVLLGAIGLWCLGVAFVIAYDAANQVEDQQRELERQECLTTNRGRADARASDLAIVGEVADYAVLSPPDKAELLARVEAASVEELPPQDC